MVTKIFEPISIGSIEAKNRIFMAPLTRARGSSDHVPTPIMAEYYGQRADAGLIISEATGISLEGLGWPRAPGIWNNEQIKHWKTVTKTVHDKGGKIVLQLWHMGRVAHSSVTGQQPVSCSATTCPIPVRGIDGRVDAEQARELTKDDIKRIVGEYAHAAKNAIAAGFDGVQIHGANGYLIDEFMRDSTNRRTDEYGGSIENRVRFLDEVCKAVVDAVGAQRTGARFSPNGEIQGCIDSNPSELFAAAARVAEKHHLSFVELRENSPSGTFHSPTDQPKQHDVVRANYHGVLVLNQDYTRDEAIAVVQNGTADAVSFGRAFISNPNLVVKIRTGDPWVKANVNDFYGAGAGPNGYTDY